MDTLDSFLRYLQSLGRSELTIQSYALDLKSYHEYYLNLGQDLTLATQEDIETYLWQKKKQGSSAATLARHLVSIRRYHRFLCQIKKWISILREVLLIQLLLLLK